MIKYENVIIAQKIMKKERKYGKMYKSEMD